MKWFVIMVCVAARYWGTRKVGLQAFLTALAVNLKRWANITLNKIKNKKDKVKLSTANMVTVSA